MTINTFLIIIIFICFIALYFLVLTSKIKGAEIMAKKRDERGSILSDPGDEVEHITNKNI